MKTHVVVYLSINTSTKEVGKKGKTVVAMEGTEGRVDNSLGSKKHGYSLRASSIQQFFIDSTGSSFPWINFPGLPPYKKKHGNHRKSYMVIYENIEVIEKAREVYGDMQVRKRP